MDVTLMGHLSYESIAEWGVSSITITAALFQHLPWLKL